MKKWLNPKLPAVPGIEVMPRIRGREISSPVRLYVCGITPYDATHLGHARTFLTFDYLVRLLRAAKLDVAYVQNVTDIDDPLLERAQERGEDWQDLARRETDLYFRDMEALRVLPPDHYVGVVESMDLIVDGVARLVRAGAGYHVPTSREGVEDIYANLAQDPALPEDLASLGLSHSELEGIFAERGGDPDRAGKRGSLDPLLWRAAREGEPKWDGGILGEGRPGWHIECASIAEHYLGGLPTITGGGIDLAFPHHPMSTSHMRMLGFDGTSLNVHTGMLGLDGEKMSKSLGNLVFVSKLLRDGTDPAVIRLALATLPYAAYAEWSGDLLTEASKRLERWKSAAASDAPSAGLTQLIAERLADDLDTAGALAIVDRWAKRAEPALGPGSSEAIAAIDGLLGISLTG